MVLCVCFTCGVLYMCCCVYVVLCTCGAIYMFYRWCCVHVILCIYHTCYVLFHVLCFDYRIVLVSQHVHFLYCMVCTYMYFVVHQVSVYVLCCTLGVGVCVVFYIMSMSCTM